METLVLEKRGHFCWLKLNRPDALNALNTGLQIEIEAYNVNLVTEDRREGIRAFNEKRPPQWQNR